MSKTLDEQTLALFDALVAHPEGLDSDQISDILGLTIQSRKVRVSVIARALRLRLGAFSDDEDDRVRGYTVPIRREGLRQIYFLSALREEGSEWQAGRTETMMSRLDIDIAYYRSLANGNDGRTREGKIARAVVRRLTQLTADIAEIRELVE